MLDADINEPADDHVVEGDEHPIADHHGLLFTCGGDYDAAVCACVIPQPKLLRYGRTRGRRRPGACGL